MHTRYKPYSLKTHRFFYFLGGARAGHQMEVGTVVVTAGESVDCCVDIGTYLVVTEYI